MNSLTSARRDTPTRSPFARSPGIRSPTKSTRQELGLNLERVIGTTCHSVNCFDCHAESRSFAFTAGAAAVLATVDEDLEITQRFFRATSLQASASRAGPGNGLLSPSHNTHDPRSRPVFRRKESDSPFNASGQEGTDSPNGRTSSVRDRVKAATAVSISKNGRFLAVGETGYRPRVLIFPILAKASCDVPVAVISEHSFGVQSVAFSLDSKLLATLGTVNDGFLHIWEVDEKSGAATLMASNKCTNVVKQVAWIGRSLVTVGVRFVKVWRPDENAASSPLQPDQTIVLSSPGHKPLAGRNSLLGDLLDATFTAVVAVSETKAIICSDSGDVCMLDDSQKQQRLTRLCTLDFAITAACLSFDGQLLISGGSDDYRLIDLEDLQHETSSAIRPDSAVSTTDLGKPSNFSTAIGALSNAIVIVDSKYGVLVRRTASCDASHASVPLSTTLASHSDSILGVRAISSINALQAEFLTWSAGGTVILWSSDCKPAVVLDVPLAQVADMHNATNELKTVSSLLESNTVVTGDKYGVLRVMEVKSGRNICDIRAHLADITDVAIHCDARNRLVASGSRDRTIQLFTWQRDQLQLLQTLDEHAGAVTCVLFAKGGTQLLSCSADRTIVLREAIDRGDNGSALFSISRTINLKSSPTCMRLSSYEDAVLLSTTDKSVQLVNTRSGRTASSFKASDLEGGDSVIMSSLVHLPSTSGSPIIAGVSSTDKSVRLYSEDGTLLARDWGHTEGVTDIALLEPKINGASGRGSCKLVTVAADGTIFIWNTLSSKTSLEQRETDTSMSISISGAIDSPSMMPPLRKVISQSELQRFQRSKSADSEPASPSTTTSGHHRSSVLRKKASRLAINTATQRAFEASPLSPLRNSIANTSRGLGHMRSPSPPPSPSPSLQRAAAAVPTTLHRSIRKTSRMAGLHTRNVNLVNGGGNGSSSSSGSGSGSAKTENVASTGFGSFSAATEQLGRSLRAYRQKLDKCAVGVPNAVLAELERELGLTLQMVQGVRPPSDTETDVKELGRGVAKLSTGGRESGKENQDAGAGAEAREAAIAAA